MEKRLNKYLSEAGYCSRREADRLIEKGIVSVNGQVATVGLKINDSDIVKVNGEIISKTARPVYIALNKPMGITSTTDRNIKDNIVDFMNYPERIFHIGRLDKLSEGLIFMTNDGDIVNKILRAGNKHEKEYIVTVNNVITDEFIDDMSRGVSILDKVTKECTVTKISDYEFSIILTEGMNRQIRRMCDYFYYQVTKLKRIRIMNINLDIPTGKWRKLTENEIAKINEMIESYTKTEEASN